MHRRNVARCSPLDTRKIDFEAVDVAAHSRPPFFLFFCCQGSAIQNYDDSSNRVRYHLHVTKTYPVCLTFRTNYNVQFFSLAPSLLFVLLVSTASAYA